MTPGALHIPALLATAVLASPAAGCIVARSVVDLDAVADLFEGQPSLSRAECGRVVGYLGGMLPLGDVATRTALLQIEETLACDGPAACSTDTRRRFTEARIIGGRDCRALTGSDGVGGRMLALLHRCGAAHGVDTSPAGGLR